MKHIARFIVAVAAVGALAGCTAGGTGAPNINRTNPHDPNFAALQFAVGTVNLYNNGNPGLNVVSTLRQPNGTSATGVNTPSISGPFTFAIAAVPGTGTLSDLYTTIPIGGPSLPETSAGTPMITGTSQTVHPGTPFCDTTSGTPGFVNCPPGFTPTDTSFGQSGGVYASGLGPFNANGGSGTAYSYQPYAQPFYGSGDGVRQLVPWGGPPAFDPDGNGMGTRDGLVPLFADSFNSPVFLGVGEGITAFEFITPLAGQYTLSTQIGTLGSGGAPTITTLTATATLNSLALLSALTTPLVAPDANGDGGATFTATLPAGVSEALVQIVDWGPGGGPLNGGASVGNCQGPKGPAFAPVYYSVFITASGNYQLGTLHGANSNLSGGITNLTPTHSICSLTDNQNPPDGLPAVAAGDNFTVEMIGFDYPAYEQVASLLQSTVPQRPTIVGANGQADITISRPMEQDYPGYAQIPLTAARHPLAARRSAGSFAPPIMAPDMFRKLGVPTHTR